MRLLVAIPVYGQHRYTEAVIGDLARETSPDFDVVVIDNKGDYETFGTEKVIRPGSNIGWARATNLAFREGFSSGYTHVMTLNNDTRLSPGFIDGFCDPRLPGDAGIIAPLYDDVITEQRTGYTGPAADFDPSPRYRRVAATDGTCLTLSKPAWRTVGDLNLDSFGRFSWGSDIHLCLRVREAGFACVVTEMSYLNHFGKKTAEKVDGRFYRLKASTTFAIGVRRTLGQKAWGELIRSQPTEIHDLDTHDLIATYDVGEFDPEYAVRG